MPKVRRRGVPEPLIRHLVRRVRERGINVNQLALLREWLLSEPEVPVPGSNGDEPSAWELTASHREEQA